MKPISALVSTCRLPALSTAWASTSRSRVSTPFAPAFILSAPPTAEAAVPKLRKVATVDMQKVLNETQLGKKARKKLETSSKAKQQKLDKKRAQLEKDQAKLQTLKGAALAKAQEDLQKQLIELQQVYMTMQQELAADEGRLLEEIYGKSKGIVDKIADELGLDLVLINDVNNIIYQKSGLDITDELVKRFNKQYQ